MQFTQNTTNFTSKNKWYENPFGVLLDERSKNGGKYRYGYQGSEKDDEVKGKGNSYDFGARMLDPRVGRWLSLDFRTRDYPELSPYVFAGNSPIQFIDPDGNIIVDPETGEQVVNVDGQWQTATGGEVSQFFTDNSAPYLNKLNETEIGRELISRYQAISTNVSFDMSDKENNKGLKAKGSNSEWYYGSKGVQDDSKNDDGLYSNVTITPSLKAIEKKAKQTGVDEMEKYLQVLSVELGHIETKEQIDNEKIYAKEMDDYSSEGFAIVYNPLLNEAVRVGKKYRDEKEIPVDSTSDIPVTTFENFNKYIKLEGDDD